MELLVTLTLWFLSFAIAGGAFWKTKQRGNVNIPYTLLRIMFSLMVGLTVWSTTTYILWSLGMDLAIGSVSHGTMSEHWWLPPASLLFAILLYLDLKKLMNKNKNFG